MGLRRKGPASTTALMPEESTLDSLEQATEMYHKGLISEEQYQAADEAWQRSRDALHGVLTELQANGESADLDHLFEEH